MNRREFLLINYIKEAMSRREFGIGALSAAAASLLPGTAYGKNKNKVTSYRRSADRKHFIKSLIPHLNKYESTDKVAYCLLKYGIILNSEYYPVYNKNNEYEYILISRMPRGSTNLFKKNFYDARVDLAERLGTNFHDRLENDDKFYVVDEPNAKPFILKVKLSPKEFIDEYIKCIKSYLEKPKGKLDKLETYEYRMFVVAFQDEPFNVSQEFDLFFKKCASGNVLIKNK